MSGGRVTLREGVTFATHDGVELVCDVFLPPEESTRPAPGVLLVHGGAWQVGEPAQLRGYGFLIGRHGYVCVIPQYRLSAVAQWPSQLHDVKAAVRWMRANAADLGLDPHRIAASGNSSGGHLALLLAGTGARQDLEGSGAHLEQSSAVQAAVAFYGPSALERNGSMLRQSVAALMGPAAADSDYLDASPVAHVDSSFPPTMLLHSNLDDLVPPAQSIAMYHALRQHDVPCELHMFDGQPHAFDAEPSLGRLSATMVVSFLQRFLPPSTLTPNAEEKS